MAGAAAGAAGVAQITAGAGVHGAHEREAARERLRPTADDTHHPVLEWGAKGLEDILAIRRELVEEQNPQGAQELVNVPWGRLSKASLG
jgi:hypothetical protein